MICPKCGNELNADSFCAFCEAKSDSAGGQEEYAHVMPEFVPPGGFASTASNASSGDESELYKDRSGFLSLNGIVSSPMMVLSMCCWIVMLFCSASSFDFSVGYFHFIGGPQWDIFLSCAPPVIFIGGMLVFAQSNIKLMVLPMMAHFLAIMIEALIMPRFIGIPAGQALSIVMSYIILALMVAVTIFVFYVFASKNVRAMPIVLWCVACVVFYCVLSVAQQVSTYGYFDISSILFLFTSWSLRELSFFFGVAFLGLAAQNQLDTPEYLQEDL